MIRRCILFIRLVDQDAMAGNRICPGTARLAQELPLKTSLPLQHTLLLVDYIQSVELPSRPVKVLAPRCRQPPPCNPAGIHSRNSTVHQTHKSLPRGEALRIVLPNLL